MTRRKRLFINSRAACAAALLAAICTSCDDAIYDALSPCPTGVEIQFRYDYNMLSTDAFCRSVDCLTVYVYDDEERLVTRCSETSAALADETYRLHLAIAPGEYHLVAYGGLACEDASFSVVTEPLVGSALSSLATVLTREESTSCADLHNFFFGAVDFVVTAGTTTFDTAVVPMMKNTNNIQVILQDYSGVSLDAEEYTFAITDDNTRFDYTNALVSEGVTTYLPYAQGLRAVAADDGDDEDLTLAAYAAFSTSRLWHANAARLTVCSADGMQTVIDIPLISYLLLLKASHYATMSDQEFLDRESEWSLIFILDESGRWEGSCIIINGWTVRINTETF